MRGLRIGCADLSHLATLGDAVTVLPQTAVCWQLATDVSEQLAAPPPILTTYFSSTAVKMEAASSAETSVTNYQ